jgi:LysM repeat protein
MRKILILGIFLSACLPADAQATDILLQSSLTSTPATTSTPNVLPPNTPIPTNTMQVYIVEEGDTLSEIAEKFRIPQEDLIAANPDLNPSTIPIGATLFIPDPSSPQAAASILTPVPVPITQAACHPTADSGNWCFALIQNNTSNLLENVSAQITLLNENNEAVATQTAFLPLDFIQPDESLPVYAFFPSTPSNVNPQIRLLSAAQGDGSGYLPARLDNTSTQIDWSGKYAIVSGQVHLPAESKAATEVWVAAVAYDLIGTVVGVRRWEGGGIEPGGTIKFEFQVSSIGGEIEAVEFFVQAR